MHILVCWSIWLFSQTLLIGRFFCEAQIPLLHVESYFFRCFFLFWENVCSFLHVYCNYFKERLYLKEEWNAEDNLIKFKSQRDFVERERILHKENLINLCGHSLSARWNCKVLPYTLSYLGLSPLRDTKRSPFYKLREVKWFVQGHTAIT